MGNDRFGATISRRAFIASVAACGTAGASASPDEQAHGRLFGYPTSRSAWDTQPYRVGNYSNLKATRPTNSISPASAVRMLRPVEKVGNPLLPNLSQRLAEHCDRFAVTGLLVAQGNQLLHEEYGYQRNAAMQFHGWSMSKSVLAILSGIAVDAGLVRSIEDRASVYVPELANTLHGETRLKDLLQMSTGARVLHKPGQEGGDLGQIYGGNLLTPKSDTIDLIKSWDARAEPSGQRFNYNELAPITVTHVLRRATGTTLSRFAEERLWKAMGAESAASWMVDSKGVEMGCVGFSATLRDWARLGLLLANDGNYGGAQVVSRDWLMKMTTISDADQHLRPKIATSHSGYGYLTWVEAYRQRRVFSMRGHQNQFLIIAPQLRLVLVQTAVDDVPPAFAQNLYAIYTALMAELEKRPIPSAS